MLVPSEEDGQIGPGKFRDIPTLCRLDDHCIPLNLLLALTHGLLPCKLLACNLPLLEDNPFEDVAVRWTPPVAAKILP